MEVIGVNFFYWGKNYIINVCYDVIFVVGFIEILKFFMFFGIGKFEYLVVLNVIFWIKMI